MRIFYIFLLGIAFQGLLSAQIPGAFINKPVLAEMYSRSVVAFQQQSYSESAAVADSIINIAGADSVAIAIGHFMRGKNYFMMQRNNRAFEDFSFALAIFHRKNVTEFLPKVYEHLAKHKLNRKDYEASIAYFDKALEYFQKTGGENLYKTLGNKALLLMETHKYHEAIDAFEEVRSVAAQHGDAYSVAVAYNNIGLAYSHIQDYVLAEKYYQLAIKTSLESHILINLGNAHNGMAHVLSMTEHYKEAIAHDLKAIAVYEDSLQTKSRANRSYERLAYNYIRLGERDKSLVYLDKYLDLKREEFDIERERVITDMEMKLDFREKENQIELLAADADVERSKKMMYLSFSLLGALLILFILYRLYLERKLRRIQEESHRESLQKEMENQQILQAQLKLKEQHLTRDGMRIVQKNTSLEKIRHSIMQVMEKSSSTVQSDLRAIVSNIRMAKSLDRDWQELRVHFEEVHPEFIRRLNAIQPPLTTKEVRLCILLKVHMDTKEIASILGVSTDAVKRAKNRLRRKLELDDGENIIHAIEERKSNSDLTPT